MEFAEILCEKKNNQSWNVGTMEREIEREKETWYYTNAGTQWAN